MTNVPNAAPLMHQSWKPLYHCFPELSLGQMQVDRLNRQSIELAGLMSVADFELTEPAAVGYS